MKRLLEENFPGKPLSCARHAADLEGHRRRSAIVLIAGTVPPPLGAMRRGRSPALAAMVAPPSTKAALSMLSGLCWRWASGGVPASLECLSWVRCDPRLALFGQQRRCAIMANGAAERDPADAASTEYFPWLGNTWYLILRTLGLRSWSLWVLFLAVALPFLWAVVRTAIDPERPVRDVMALGLLAAFFVAPYGRDYDFPVLWVPALVLIGDRLSEKAGAALLVGLIVIPYLQFILLVRYSRLIVPEVDFYIECTYFWVPALLAILWFATDSRQRPPVTA